MIEIALWFDFACPYCYIGETRLHNAIRTLGIADDVKITYRAYELEPESPADGWQTTLQRMEDGHDLSEAEATKRIDEIDTLGNELGLDFHFMQSKNCNTRSAHRLLKLATERYDAKVADAFMKGVFEAFFSKGLLIADTEVLTDIAVRAGMRKEDVDDVLGSHKYSEEVMADETAADRRGVEIIPYFLINNKRSVPGPISEKSMENLLRREAAK